MANVLTRAELDSYRLRRGYCAQRFGTDIRPVYCLTHDLVTHAELCAMVAALNAIDSPYTFWHGSTR